MSSAEELCKETCKQSHDKIKITRTNVKKNKSLAIRQRNPALTTENVQKFHFVNEIFETYFFQRLFLVSGCLVSNLYFKYMTKCR